MENGNVKIRGLETRRSDTPGFIFDAQTEMTNALKPANNTTELYQRIPEALKVLKNYRQRLLKGDVSISDLIVTKHMSKEPKTYRQQVSQVIAAQQLSKQGSEVPAGNSVKFVFTNVEHKRYERRVKALQLIEKNVTPDTKKYLLLLYASAGNLLSFAGYTPQKIYDAVKNQHQTNIG